MKLVSFSLKNYRSIKSAEKIALGDLTILIGPNNEGKSNILRGLVTGMGVLSLVPSPHGRGARVMTPRGLVELWEGRDQRQVGGIYEWERDFPISLQEKSPNGKTTFDFEFELSDSEVEDFKRDVKSNLNGLLPIRLTLGRKDVLFEVRKRGRGQATLTAKRAQIARFVGERLDMKDIPTVRTASAAMRLVDEMVQRELSRLEQTPEYRQAVEKITEIQGPVLNELSKTIQQMLGTFLPDVKAVQIEVEDRYRALRRDSRIVVDDGTATDLRYKGDGVQSLAAISLIHHISQQSAGSSELVLAIEEPEAHLHPRAIHQVREVLKDIAARQQVVLTTHSPLLVNRGDITKNVIVDKSRARTARSIAQIREALGVRVSDSLAAAEIVLVVEGEHDRVSITALLRSVSTRLASAFDDGIIAIEALRGASNLTFKLSSLRDQLCVAHAFVDYDAAGLQAVQNAEREGLLDSADRSFATSPGMRESELEDLFDFALYREMVRRRYNVDLNTATFRARRRKWTERVRQAFLSAGQHWDDQVCRQVKQQVAELVELKPDSALFDAWRSPLDALASAVTTKLEGA